MMDLYHINGREIQENIREVELTVLSNYRGNRKDKGKMTSN